VRVAGQLLSRRVLHRRHDNVQAFVVSEAGGKWGLAQEIPGLPRLSAQADAAILAVSCPPAGNCAAGGAYLAGGFEHGFVVSETGGTWGQARQVPGLAALGSGDSAVSVISCVAAGNCAAGGQYAGQNNEYDYGKAFLVSEVGGIWGTARQVPGLAKLNKGDRAEVTTVSCPSPGNCSAGGCYASRGAKAGPPDSIPFVIAQSGGNWSTALKIGGTADPGTSMFSAIAAMSCPAAGQCTAVGSSAGTAFALSQT
jgi:hypothetical protein